MLGFIIKNMHLFIPELRVCKGTDYSKNTIDVKEFWQNLIFLLR